MKKLDLLSFEDLSLIKGGDSIGDGVDIVEPEFMDD